MTDKEEIKVDEEIVNQVSEIAEKLAKDVEPKSEKDEVIDAVSIAIEEQARTTAFMRLDEAKSKVILALSVLGSSVHDLSQDSKEELTTIVDFLIERTEKEIVWNECKNFRKEIVDEIVAQWKAKKR